MVRKWLLNIINESITNHHNIYTSELNCIYEAFGKIHDRFDNIEELIHENKQLKEENERLKRSTAQVDVKNIVSEWLGDL